ncbi:ATP-binding protein [Cerasicoccus fimbriatus]|uniref:ATP-binding protein n=1 Tax=Cerasicoccus fimbriatus TaxID=3014554 RepID=UPI0022B353F6|nr:ATP-binding protein [Cerasicoccus sp. TK19100]
MDFLISTGGLLIGLLVLIALVFLFDRFHRKNEKLLAENERLKKQLAHSLEVAEKAEATADTKELFLATMSHEIRTPLNCINGLSEILITSDPRPDQLEYLNTITQSTDALLNILTNVLDYTKINAGSFEIQATRFSLSHVIEEVHTLFKEEASRKDIVFECNHNDDDKELQVICDRNCLRQALVNLVSNAIKYTDQGHIQLEVFYRHYTTNGTKNQYEVAIQVADTGIGIDPAKRNELFKPFHQLVDSKTRKYEGTGLGLSISKFMVEKGLGGTINYEPSESGGARFNIRFFAEGFVTKKETLGSKLSSRSLLKTSLSKNLFVLDVLVVDDNTLNCITMKAILEKMGHRADFATDGLKAQEQLVQKPYNLIFMDIMMPNVDGIEATQAIRSGACGPEYVNIPIVATTAFANVGDGQKFLDAGMNYYLSKPVIPDAIRAILTETGRQIQKGEQPKAPAARPPKPKARPTA